MLRRRQSLTILTSQPLSRHRVVQILPTWLPKVLPSCHLSTSLTSKRLSRHSLVQILRGSTKKCSDAATVFNDFTSQPLSRHSLVQILPTWPSKSAPIMPSFNEFGFQTALSPQPGANFAACDFKKSSDHASFWRFWFPNRSFGLARRHLGQPILRARPFLGTPFASQRQPHNYGQTWHFAQFLPAKTTASHTFVLYRFCAIAFFVDGFSAATLSIVAS